ncbi:hypothetical protein VMCG_02961 [Cytospora schulzeri]|uniref:ubiquitinyl hydrolase 1 n=1 Tax=Cytospora schulzeri TaxID=448051 RepID=A0A423WZG9_9PEZI|nr:hypothetical protein VMCG_02961 [Valsa malicola]
MTSSTLRDSRRYDPFQNHLTYGSYYSGENLRDRILQPSVLVTLSIILLTLGYHLAQNHAASRGRQLPTIPEVLWDALVFVIPAFVLYAVDRWVNPPLFPIPMLSSQPTTHAAKSDVLRKILRADQPGGIVASVSQAGRRTLSHTFSGLKGDISQPAGLGNWDNSCFQNSILQGLASLKHLPRYLGGFTPAERPPHNDQTTTAGSLRAFIAELNDSSNNGKTLFTPGVLKNMSTIQQQDAQEYFSKLLDQIDKDIEKGAKAACKLPGYETDPSKDDTAASQHSDDSGYQSLPTLSKAGSELVTMRNPLEGLSAQRVACTACGYSEGLSMIPFNCLTLNFEGGVPHYDLFELLDNLVRLESIEGVECVKCTLLHYQKGLQPMAKALPAAAARLKVIEDALEEDEFDDKIIKTLKIPDNKMVSSTKTKQVVIGRPPPSLVMHMNRSVFDPTTFRSYKNLAAVQFPKTLDLGPWCIGSAEGVRIPAEARKDGVKAQVMELNGDKEQWVLDARASMVAGDAHPSRISGPIYELRAVVTHYGRHENGHYVCYRRHPRRSMKVPGSSKVEGKSDQPPNLAGDELANDVDDINESRLDEAITDEPYGEDADAQWWRLSDETVTKVGEQDVLSQGGVFMLFYDCIDPNSVLVTSGATTEANDSIKTPATNTEVNGRKSPSLSGNSVATLCNPPAEPAQSKFGSYEHPATLFGILSAK